MDKIKKLQELIDNSDNIVFFGGAGVSTESGIKDFRGKNGLYKEKYNNYSPEYMLSRKCLYENTKDFYDYYKKNMNMKGIKPNITHMYLKKLEDNNKLKAIITQNIDGLDSLAGCKNVLEIHGTINKNYCDNCNKDYPSNYIFESNGIPRCECGGLIRPKVVLYGEALPKEFDEAAYYISNCDLLIVAGTSLTVEPAASLVKLFRGDNFVIINLDKTPYDFQEEPSVNVEEDPFAEFGDSVSIDDNFLE